LLAHASEVIGNRAARTRNELEEEASRRKERTSLRFLEPRFTTLAKDQHTLSWIERVSRDEDARRTASFPQLVRHSLLDLSPPRAVSSATSQSSSSWQFSNVWTFLTGLYVRLPFHRRSGAPSDVDDRVSDSERTLKENILAWLDYELAAASSDVDLLLLRVKSLLELRSSIWNRRLTWAMMIGQVIAVAIAVAAIIVTLATAGNTTKGAAAATSSQQQTTPLLRCSDMPAIRLQAEAVA
jgi:hypothetical protein